MVVKKPKNKVHLCGDYKVTVKPRIKTDHYLLPAVEDIFAVLAGSKVFTGLDLSAYQQIELRPDLWPLLTINAPMG